jgi:hypothetical protein
MKYTRHRTNNPKVEILLGLAIGVIAAITAAICIWPEKTSDILHIETEEVERGMPYTTEYDYSLEETETVTEAATKPVTESEPETEAITEAVTEPVTEVVTEPTTEAVTEPETDAESIIPTFAWTDIDEVYATYIAKALYIEFNGESRLEQAAVVWCILNRVD